MSKKSLPEFFRFPESSDTLKVKMEFNSVKISTLYACQPDETALRISE